VTEQPPQTGMTSVERDTQLLRSMKNWSTAMTVERVSGCHANRVAMIQWVVAEMANIARTEPVLHEVLLCSVLR
jgi:hypothetical protein